MQLNNGNIIQKIRNFIKIYINKKDSKIKQILNKIFKYLNNNGILMMNQKDNKENNR